MLIGFHIYLLPNAGLTSVYTTISLEGAQEPDFIPYWNFRVLWCSKQVEGMLCEEPVFQSQPCYLLGMGPQRHQTSVNISLSASLSQAR